MRRMPPPRQVPAHSAARRARERERKRAIAPLGSASDEQPSRHSLQHLVAIELAYRTNRTSANRTHAHQPQPQSRTNTPFTLTHTYHCSPPARPWPPHSALHRPPDPAWPEPSRRTVHTSEDTTASAPVAADYWRIYCSDCES